MTLDRYYELEEAGELPEASFTTYVARDAYYMQMKDKEGVML